MGAEVAAYLEREIASRGLLPGDKLPTERELAARLSVSRGTVRSALQDLESKHLLERAPGRGTRVAAPPAPVSELYARLAGVDQAQQDVAELRGSMEPLVAELAALPSPDVPALFGLGGDEAIVQPQAIRERVARWQGVEFAEYPGARHELLMERAEVRGDFLSRVIALFDRSAG